MINTVTGSIRQKEIGITLSHEHLFCDFKGGDSDYTPEEMLENCYNKLLPILKKLYDLGCQSIVEVSASGNKENIMLMHRLSVASGIKILLSTGLPYGDYSRLSESNDPGLIEKISQKLIKDYTYGMETMCNSVVAPSHMKMFITGHTITDMEKKVLEASIAASRATGMPLQCHILFEDAAQRIFDILEEKEFNFSKFLWAHAGYDNKFNLMEKMVSRGVWLGFDIIQRKNYDKYFNMIKRALEIGYSSKILLSSDYDFMEQTEDSKDTDECLGLLRDFIPFCESKCMNRDILKDILSVNPGNFYNL